MLFIKETLNMVLFIHCPHIKMSCGVTSGTPLSVLVTHALLNVHMQSNRLGRLYLVFSVMFFTV